MPTRTLPKPYKKIGPLFLPKHFKDAKDPCITWDGVLWHLYGSGGSVKEEEWQIIHATATDILGPWHEQAPARLIGLGGPHVAAPSIHFDFEDSLFHMCVQRDFMALGGSIEYLVSADGRTFTHMHTILDPILNSGEGGLYDPHFAEIYGKKYMVYSGMPTNMTYDRPFVPQPDVYLAESDSKLWSGPWSRVKQILNHEDISWHHNSRENPDYEWGIEGPQLVELPDGEILLNATCFVEEGMHGTRQRVFFAVSRSGPEGPYKSLGPVLSERGTEWEAGGENGHASAWVRDDTLYLFYQAKAHGHADPRNDDWKYGLALFNIQELLE
jgi:hypothetical protein